jgi:hypothetical protein
VIPFGVTFFLPFPKKNRQKKALLKQQGFSISLGKELIFHNHGALSVWRFNLNQLGIYFNTNFTQYGSYFISSAFSFQTGGCHNFNFVQI